MTLPETIFDAEIAEGVASGHLCPKPLTHGSTTLCGRPVDESHGVGLCRWHSEQKLGLPHGDEGTPLRYPCVQCGERERVFRVTKLCKFCHRRRFRDLSDVVQGIIVESSL